MTFIDLIVYPLFETWSELVYPEAQHILDNLTSTREYWHSHMTTSPPPPLHSHSDYDSTHETISEVSYMAMDAMLESSSTSEPHHSSTQERR